MDFQPVLRFTRNAIFQNSQALIFGADNVGIENIVQGGC